MIDRLFNNETMGLIQKSLDASSMQQKLIANNLANVDTPGFKRSEVVFQAKLQAALDTQKTTQTELPAALTDPRHIAFSEQLTLDQVKPSIVQRNDTTLRNDGNNVDIDTEMSDLAQTQVFYSSLAAVAKKQFSILQSAIFEGKR